MIGNFN